MTTDAYIATHIDMPAEQRRSMIGALLFLAFATCALFPNFMLAGAFGPVWMVWIGIATIVALFLSAETAFCMLMLCLFLQNLFISLCMPLIPTLDLFTPLLGSSFVNVALTFVFSLVVWLKLRTSLAPESSKLLMSMLAFFVVIAIYTPIGMAHSSGPGALTYARVYMIGGMMLTAGIAFGFQLNQAFTANVLIALAFFLGTWGIIERFFPETLYTLANTPQYIHLKYDSSKTTDVTNVQQLINFVSRSYLNLSGSLGLDITVVRPWGPNVHPISYAYALSFSAVVCYMYRRVVPCVLCLVSLVLVGAKGSIIIAFGSIALGMLYVFSRSTKLVLSTLLGAMAFYLVVGIVYGFYTEDYHVIGLMGGVKGFFQNPIGYGIGVGGNLSELADTKTDFDLWQGYGANFALESAFGVMIYQIGLASIIFFVFYWKLFWNVWKAVMHFASEPRLIALPCSLAILIVNSVFQEEALSPAGWGPLLLISGLLLARYWQEDIFNVPAKTEHLVPKSV